ncbi:BT4734/BF3469 family protein [uncultured Parabacteroides sp.]|uniref:BT4734/BF3469 family protein n=1 Tax=uncultured Parabacteroides sp. TaxID=512312 RepID=UPI002804A254|nr:BT4734/BF3469 family protein [uncultured Parabacteroides sp.]MBD9167862.1 hypothetical protein [Parabacteroides johnsonii]
MKVTLYRYEKETLVMRSVEMEKLLLSLRKENQSKPVSNAREKILFALPDRRNNCIQKLPVIVFGATYHKTDEPHPPMRNYTGLVLLEVNHLSDIREAVLIRQQAACMPQTLLAFIGLSGKSVKIVVPFTLPDGTLPDTQEQIKRFHAQAYLTAVKYYQPQLGRNIMLIDPIPGHGCRMSFDPQLVYNPDAVAIRIEQPARMPELDLIRIIPEAPTDPLDRLMPGMERNYRIATLFSVALVDAIQKSGGEKEDNRNRILVRLAQNCLNAGIPEEDAVQCALLYEDLNLRETEIRMTFRSVYLLRKAMTPHEYLPEVMSITLQLEEFMLRRYEFRRNTMSGEAEYRDKSLIRFTFNPFTREARNSICTEAHKEGLNVWDKDIERHVYSDNVPDFFPIEEYLGHLPEWDGTDHIRTLAKRVPCNNPQWPGQFYRWFLSMVAHWLGLDREHGNSTTPLLVGDQGCGKSTYCLNILPPELRQFYTDSIDFSKRRDTELALHRYALVNIDEFDSVKETQQSYLKHILQKANVSTRLPYQTANRNLRRYATFIATSNNFNILTDPTGSRRFICIEVTDTIDYVQPIDYEQLYAQAMEALANSERYWFTHEEETEIVANNRQFQQIPPEEQLFLQYFRLPKKNEAGEFLLSIEILGRIKQKRRDFNYTKNVISNFGRLLKRNGIPSKRSNRGTIYQVVELNKS